MLDEAAAFSSMLPVLSIVTLTSRTVPPSCAAIMPVLVMRLPPLSMTRVPPFSASITPANSFVSAARLFEGHSAGISVDDAEIIEMV